MGGAQYFGVEPTYSDPLFYNESAPAHSLSLYLIHNAPLIFVHNNWLVGRGLSIYLEGKQHLSGIRLPAVVYLRFRDLDERERDLSRETRIQSASDPGRRRSAVCRATREPPWMHGTCGAARAQLPKPD